MEAATQAHPSFESFSLDDQSSECLDQTEAGVIERPPGPRRSTDPVLVTIQTTEADIPPQLPVRTRSPYSRSHLRSSTVYTNGTAPPMARTRSLPTASLPAGLSISPSHSPVRPSSPLRSPAPTRVSPSRAFDESHAYSPLPPFMDIESIAEDSELDIPPRPSPSLDFQGPSASAGLHGHTFPRSSASRRRPSSPLYSLTTSSPSQAHVTSFPSSASALSPSPSMTPPPLNHSKFNEPYPSHQLTLSTTSSVASTPSSLRSRSPSISSLETIPDSPDAEEAATEAFNIARLRAAAEAEEAADSDGERKIRTAGGLDHVGGGSLKSFAWPNAGLAKDKRKRWSVCGAERRGDFEMETIWEDR